MRPSEEVARYAFEVYVEQTSAGAVSVAFANPTAGPWKTAKLTAPGRGPIELHRFGREEQRPDLVLIAAARKLALVVEAKGPFGDLARAEELQKAERAFAHMSDVLGAALAAEGFAGIRFAPGLLWATANFEAEVAALRGLLGTCWTRQREELVFIGISGLESQVRVQVAGYGARGPWPGLLARA